jgi:hypothetical protein
MVTLRNKSVGLGVRLRSDPLRGCDRLSAVDRALPTRHERARKQSGALNLTDTGVHCSFEEPGRQGGRARSESPVTTDTDGVHVAMLVLLLSSGAALAQAVESVG